jgi:enamine deaminase RidA (YjgF/YER057c/UK114 family)
MTKTLINPPSLPTPRGFNHGILTEGGQLLFLAGQDAGDGNGQIVAVGDMVGQAEQVLSNLQAVVVAGGGQMTNIVKLNLYVTDKALYKNHLKEMGDLFRRYFGRYYPTMALFEVKSLFQDDALIEMEGMAVID